MHLLTLEARLPAVLRGEVKPADAAETLQFAEVCRLKTQYADAARLSAAAFADKPTLADNVAAAYRYNAACAAALAGCGRGEGKLSAEEQARWAQQARAWLRADLTAWSAKLESDRAKFRDTVRQTLKRIGGLRSRPGRPARAGRAGKMVRGRTPGFACAVERSRRSVQVWRSGRPPPDRKKATQHCVPFFLSGVCGRFRYSAPVSAPTGSETRGPAAEKDRITELISCLQSANISARITSPFFGPYEAGTERIGGDATGLPPEPLAC